jgi:predicted 2-oxoglutarate/Fe(II)-dependent dioxygenase YbiX
MTPAVSDLIDRLGVANDAHSGSTLRAHLEGTGAILARRGFPAHVVAAGELHSIYGTEFFTPSVLPHREAVRAAVGEQAERLVWLFCRMRRSALRRARETGILDLRDHTAEKITPDEWTYLEAIRAANQAEQWRPRDGKKYALRDTSNEIATAEGIELRVLPRDMDEPIFFTESLISPLECFHYASHVDKLVQTGDYRPSMIFSDDLRSTRLGSEVRSSANLRSELAFFDPLYRRMNEVVEAHAQRLYEGCDYAPRVHNSQLLVYHEADHFVPHSDNTIRREGRLVTNTPWRQIVGLLWLTDSSDEADPGDKFRFTGGEFFFPNLIGEDGEPMRIRPKAGMMIFFPANYWFRHGVARVGAGRRISVARWWHVFDPTNGG